MRTTNLFSEEFRIKIDASKMQLSMQLAKNGKSIAFYLYKLTLT